MTEVEIKLAVGPADLQVRVIEGFNADLVHPRGYEENVVLDLPGALLRGRGAMLRVRKFGGKGSLTYKEPASGPKGYKTRREIESVIADAGRVVEILEAVGFRQVWRYAKYRTVYRIGDLEVLLDETPIGNYLELEGPSEAIDAFARRLGRSPAEYIVSTYRALHEAWCTERGLAAGDLLFEEGRPE